MGAVAWGNLPTLRFPTRSSNRTCRTTASGFPTDFTVRPTTGYSAAGVRGAEGRVLAYTKLHKRTGVSHALPPYADARGSRARAHRRSGQPRGMPPDASHGRSNSTSRADTGGHQQIAHFGFEPLHALLGRNSHLGTIGRSPCSSGDQTSSQGSRSAPCRAFLSEVFASLSVSPSLVITACVHARASSAHPRLRMTKSSA